MLKIEKKKLLVTDTGRGITLREYDLSPLRSIKTTSEGPLETAIFLSSKWQSAIWPSIWTISVHVSHAWIHEMFFGDTNADGADVIIIDNPGDR